MGDAALTRDLALGENAGDTAHPRTTGLPVSAVLGLLVGLGALTLASLPLLDVDIYWHVLAGDELASGSLPSEVGEEWSFAPSTNPWTSSQWLSELGLSALYRAGDWSAIVGFRVLSAMVALAVLAVTTLRGRPAALASLPFLCAGVAVWLNSQDRPQQITLIGAAVLGGVMQRGAGHGRPPRWWLVIPVTIVWANLHGGWILVPAVLALSAAAWALDHGIRDRIAWRFAALAAAALAAGAVTPAGLSNLTSLVRVSAAARGLIEEWDPTVPFSISGWFILPMAGLFGIAWARSAHVPRSEILVVAALTIYGLSAWRNLAPALLMLAPMAAESLCRAFPRASRAAEPTWSRPLGVALAASLTGIALLGLAGRDHLPRQDYPVGLAHAVADLQGPQRLLNDYAVAGMVLFFTQGEAQVAIDGRTDRYGPEYISRYLDALNLRDDWRQTLTELAPTSALLQEESPLSWYLTSIEGWKVLGAEAGYVLLAPEGS